ncbi:MAG: hypothetical protein WC553_00900 [Patescibacteria group bacterium]
MNERFQQYEYGKISTREQLVTQALCGLEESYARENKPRQAIAYPVHAEVRWLPGGTMAEMTPIQRYDHLCRLAEDPDYMINQFTDEGALLGIVNKFIVAEPTSPYSGQHITIFREPAGLGEIGRAFDNLTGLDPQEQTEFISLNLAIRNKLAEEFPDQQFIIGVNRSARPRLEETNSEKPQLIVGAQSVPILHSHIVNRRMVPEEQSFIELYNPDTSPEDKINAKLLSLRTTYVTDRLQQILQNYLKQYTNLSVFENTGRFIDINLDEDCTEMTHQIALVVGLAEDMFEELEWGKVYDTLPEVLQGDVNFGYSWAITPENHLRIGFTPHNSGSIELFDVVLDRSLLYTSTELQQARQTTRDVVMEILSSLQRD